ncbi:hypothetical protein O0R52_21770 (plasmid) [Bacillus halotolerans]|uniref:DUF3800 domain-containing protein n=1 Tax=Bacillus halotolerans TaxID=260554 RepID=A0ABY7I6L9_9BACI|nr:hypothetical protein [Bacillus halotolerans]WAT23628.1 hypothetical protein O0R52_21770 [Bacillus halotolerans]
MGNKNLFVDTGLDKNSSIKQIAAAMYDHLDQWGWKSSYTYKRKEPKQFKAKALPEKMTTTLRFNQYMYYITCMFLDQGGNFDLTKREFKRYNNDKGLACVYYSVLFYLLIKEEDSETQVLNNKKIKYVQGFYRHKLKADIPDLIAPLLGGETQLGIHAFVTIDEAVFDFTISQQAHAFDLEQSYVAGNIPDGFEYFGYEESITVVNDYWEMFAKEAGMHPKEWLLQHKINALKLAINDIKSFGQKGMV